MPFLPLDPPWIHPVTKGSLGTRPIHTYKWSHSSFLTRQAFLLKEKHCVEAVTWSPFRVHCPPPPSIVSLHWIPFFLSHPLRILMQATKSKQLTDSPPFPTLSSLWFPRHKAERRVLISSLPSLSRRKVVCFLTFYCTKRQGLLEIHFRISCRAKGV